MKAGPRDGDERKYIYCIANGGSPKELDAKPIGNAGGKVYAVTHGELSAVVSDAPAEECRVTRDNILAHQLVMEAVMKEHTILPVRFATIGKNYKQLSADQRLKEKVLEARYQEFKDLIAQLEGMIALGVKALWMDMNSIFREIADEDSTIRRLRGRVVPRDVGIQVGARVKKALEQKRTREESDILNVLRPLAHDLRVNQRPYERVVTNSTFLVPARRKPEFDNRVTQLAAQYEGRTKFRYVGPLPPSDFVEITVTWDE